MKKQVLAIISHVRRPEVWPRICIWAVVLLSLLLRTWNLGVAPDFSGDEGSSLETAKGVWQYGTMTRWFLRVPYLDHAKGIVSYWLMARVFDIFGMGVWQARIVAALAGVMTTFLVIQFAKMALGWEAGAIAGLFHATSYHILMYERCSKATSLAAMLVLAAALLLYLALQRKNVLTGVLAGLVAGLSLVTKIAFAYFLAAVLLYAIGQLLLGKQRREVGQVLLAFVVGLAIPGAGWLLYYNYWEGQEVFAAGREAYGVLQTYIPRASRYTLTSFDFSEVGFDLNAYQARTMWVIVHYLVWDPIRCLGVLGAIYLLARKRQLGIAWYMVMTVLAGLVAYWIFDGATGYYFPSNVMAYAMSGVFIGSLWEACGKSQGLRYGLAVGIGLICLFGVTLTVPMDTYGSQRERYPTEWGPVLEADRGYNIATARWIEANLPAEATYYGPSTILALTQLRYVPTLYDDYAEVFRKYRPTFLVLDREGSHAIAEGTRADPHKTLELRLIREVKSPFGDTETSLYRIEGLKAAETVLSQRALEYLRAYPTGRPPDFSPEVLEQGND